MLTTHAHETFPGAYVICQRRFQQDGIVFLHLSKLTWLTKEVDKDLCWRQVRSLGPVGLEQ